MPWGYGCSQHHLGLNQQQKRWRHKERSCQLKPHSSCYQAVISSYYNMTPCRISLVHWSAERRIISAGCHRRTPSAQQDAITVFSHVYHNSWMKIQLECMELGGSKEKQKWKLYHEWPTSYRKAGMLGKKFLLDRCKGCFLKSAAHIQIFKILTD